MAHICHYLTAAAGKSPTKLLTVCGERCKAAHQVQARVGALAAALTDTLAVQPGDVVALALDSTDLFLESLLAVAAAGGISAPLNLRWGSTDAAAAINLCQARIILLDAANLQFQDLVGSPGCTCCQHGVFVGPQPGGDSFRCGYSGELLIQQRMSTKLLLKHSPDGAAIICFTSGTTGQPKGALISHTALHCQAMAKLMVIGYNHHDVYMHAAPLFHIGGLSSAIAVLMAGGTHVFMGCFIATDCLDTIARQKITAFIAVPAMVADLTAVSTRQAGKAGRNQFPSVQRILVGAGGLSAHQVAALPVIFPQATVHSAYGMTEACSSMTFKLLLTPACSNGCPPTDSTRSYADLPVRLGVHVGTPPPGIEMAVLKTPETGSRTANEPVACGATSPESADGVSAVESGCAGEGELLTRGPHVLMRYWGQAVDTGQVMLPGGWFRTGDVGRVDVGGSVWLQGRLRDVIRSGGESVHAVEVEQVLSRHPAVLAAAVFGIPHERFGEQVAAVLRLDTGYMWTGPMLGVPPALPVPAQPVTPASVQTFCRQASLSPYKLPRVIAVQYEPLPMNASGKVLKLKLKHALLELHLQPDSPSPKQGIARRDSGATSTALSKL